MIFRLFLSLCFSLWLMPLPAQDELSAYRRAADNLVLLRNENHLLPLQHLETARPLYLTVGLPDSVFIHTLQQYLPVRGFHLPDPLFRPGDAAVMGQPTHFILAVQPAAVPAEALPQVWALATQLAAARPTILVWIGPGSPIDVPVLSDVAGLIHVPDAGHWSQSLAAQLIFGGASTTARLAQPLSPGFPAGSGLTAAAATRLGYAPPAAVGMDSALLHDSIGAILRTSIEAGAFPGAQVLVARDGKVVYHEAFGYHTYDGLRPLRTDDIYDMASVTKVSASLPALMRLYGQGRLLLDAPLDTYLPLLRGSNKDDLTYRQVLAHVGRLYAWIPFWRGTLRGNSRYPWQNNWSNTRLNDFRFRNRTFRQDSSRRFNVFVTDNLWLHRNYRKRMLRAIRKSPLNAEPGYVYSDLGFILMPEVIQNITEQPFESYLKENFYRPLGAATLTFNPLRYYAPDRIVPTERDTFFRMKLLHGTVHDEGASMFAGVSGHAGLFGSAADLAKLWQMYLNGGTYGGERFIADTAVAEFARCQYCDEGIRRGLGFDKPLIEYDSTASMVARAASPKSFGHSGYTGTFVWADPDENLLYIFLSNRVYPTRDNPLISRLSIRPRIHTVLYEAIQEE